MQIPFSVLRSVLEQHNEHYRILPIGGEQKLLIWEGGGRFFGPYSDGLSCGLLWTPEALSSAAAFAAFRQAGGWNLGGDRLWVAPEFPFFTKQRAKFNETYTVQPSLDPAHYRFAEAPEGEVLLESVLEAELYESEYAHKKFFAQRRLRPDRNPLLQSRRYAELMQNIRYCGFTQEILLRDLSMRAPMELEIWNLCQVRAGGVFIVPHLGKEAEFVDYYTPSMGKVLSLRDGYAAVSVCSEAEHKLGFQAYQTFGRVGYFLPEVDGTWSLLIRNYRNDPSDRYIKEPSNRSGENGCSLFIYMNDTRTDGFAELETAGQTFGRNGQDTSSLALNYWFFRGSFSGLQKISEVLLGVIPEEWK